MLQKCERWFHFFNNQKFIACIWQQISTLMRESVISNETSKQCTMTLCFSACKLKFSHSVLSELLSVKYLRHRGKEISWIEAPCFKYYLRETPINMSKQWYQWSEICQLSVSSFCSQEIKRKCAKLESCSGSEPHLQPCAPGKEVPVSLGAEGLNGGECWVS